MATFGKRLRECREDMGLSQQKFAKSLNTSHSVIGRYERDEMVPSIEVAKKMATLLNTTVGYLIGEINESNLFKDPIMLNRFKAISNLSDHEKECVLFNLDAVLRDAQAKQAYAL